MICSVQWEFQLPPCTFLQRIPHHQQPRTYTGQNIFHSYANDGFFRQGGCTKILFCSTIPPSWNISKQTTSRDLSLSRNTLRDVLTEAISFYTWVSRVLRRWKSQSRPLKLKLNLDMVPVFPRKMLPRALVDDENVRQQEQRVVLILVQSALLRWFGGCRSLRQ